MPKKKKKKPVVPLSFKKNLAAEKIFHRVFKKKKAEREKVREERGRGGERDRRNN